MPLLRVLLLLCVFHMELACSSTGSKSIVKCLEKERFILMELKQGFQNQSGRLATWVGNDCCAWQGLRCDKLTGHITSINLSLPQDLYQNFDRTKASIEQSLGGLEHLRSLDLSNNNFASAPFPHFLDSFKELTYLNLCNCNFSGPIPESFGNISRLRYLDLSENYIPDSSDRWLHTLSRLYSIRILKLSYCGLNFFSQTLSSSSFPFLSLLDLSHNNFNSTIPQWLSQLTSLEHLDLSYSYIVESDAQWLHKFSRLRSLRTLQLVGCGLNSFPQTLPNSSFASLSLLDLSGNEFNSTIPGWLFTITSLQELHLLDCQLQGTVSKDIGAMSSLEILDLSINNLQGLIPVEIGNLSNLRMLDMSDNSLVMAINPKLPWRSCNLRELYLSGMRTQHGTELKDLGSLCSRCTRESLEVLDFSESNIIGNLSDWLWELKNLKSLILSNNSIQGSIPPSISKLTSLQELYISNNQLNGSIDKAIGYLSKLETLDLGSNHLKGNLTESHFSQLVCLNYLDTSHNSLALDVGSQWMPPFQLYYIDMSGCQVGPLFPPWLERQKNLSTLQMSSSSIRDSLPDWFWSFASNIGVVSLSDNYISGKIPNLASIINNSNNRSRKDYSSFDSLIKLDLSNNSFSGPLSVDFAQSMPYLAYLDLSMNNFTGSIPYSLCELPYLQVVDLSKNGLSGDIPSCWNKTPDLWYVNFGDNHISGELPCSFCFSDEFYWLFLYNNSLSGEIPSCLKNCTQLTVLHIGNNRLTGSIPGWLGENLLDLRTLIMRSNMFVGRIPPQLSFLSSLNILDLSGNKLSGEIPQSLGNLTEMQDHNIVDQGSVDAIALGKEILIDLVTKGLSLYYNEYAATYIATIDLSCNMLSGEIPMELTQLTGLQNLNLSNNHVQGEIPSKIEKLTYLESLDLSRNQLDGPIPESLSHLSFLSRLNLSYNILSGRIPTGTQLQTQDPSSYMGNLNLCGPPLNKSCEPQSVEPSNPYNYDSNQGGEDSIWNFGSMGFGFAAGLLGFCGFILFRSKWSDAYIIFLDKFFDRFFIK